MRLDKANLLLHVNIHEKMVILIMCNTYVCDLNWQSHNYTIEMGVAYCVAHCRGFLIAKVASILVT